MSHAERDTRIKEGVHVIERTARSVMGKKAPRGVTLDDLISLGHEEIVKAADKYDPRDGRPWLGYLVAWLKFRFRDFLRSARKRAARTAEMDIPTEDGNSLPRPDRKAKDPGEHAAARESMASGRAAVKAAVLAASVPTPDETAAKAAEYRDALRAAVPPADLGGLLKAMLKQGMGGDVAAAKLVINVMMPAAPPPPPPPINVRVTLPGDDEE